MKNLIILLIFVAVTGVSLATNPGIRLRLTDKGLAYGKTKDYSIL
jgi:hypothetical protein